MLKGQGVFRLNSNCGVRMDFLRDLFSKPSAMVFFQLVGLLGASVCAIRGKRKFPADAADFSRYVFSVSRWVVSGKRKSPADAADFRRFVFSVSKWVVVSGKKKFSADAADSAVYQPPC